MMWMVKMIRQMFMEENRTNSGSVLYPTMIKFVTSLHCLLVNILINLASVQQLLLDLLDNVGNGEDHEDGNIEIFAF